MDKEEEVDEILPYMEIVLRKQLQGVSLDQLYKACWSEDVNHPFYATWLEQDGKENIVVGPWEMAADNPTPESHCLGHWHQGCAQCGSGSTRYLLWS